MKGELNMQKKSILKTIIKIILILFILYNIIWLCFYFFYYRGFASKIKSLDDIDSIGEYTYSVDPPYYLQFDFSLSISETRMMTKEGKDISGLSTDLIIWPKLFKEDEYGIMINYKKSEHGDGTEFGADSIMIDSKGNPLHMLDKEEQKHFDEQKENIETIIKLAKEMWGI